MRPATPILDRTALLGLRWAGTAVLAGALTAGAIGWLPFPGVPIALGVLAAAIALNAVLHRVTDERAVGAVLLLDVAVLTALLATSGGASNPFTLLFLLPVVLTALMLSPAWTAVVATASFMGFASLLLVGGTHVHHMDMTQHLIGMLVAYAATVPIVAAALHRFRLATAQAEAEAHRARASLEASERLASLAALAGGAAHELATPLSTILLIASELEADVDPSLHSELAAIGDEVHTCRTILDQLAVELGMGQGESAETVDLQRFVREASPDVTVDAEPVAVTVPTRLLAQAIRRLVGNARDAGAKQVTVRARRDADRVHIDVDDDGSGMEPATLARACEPFFTTKPSSEGRGLGLFFVYSLAHQLGGSFSLESSPGRGTTAHLSVPCGVA